MIDAKTLHDMVGHYNRFDILSILYRRRTPKPIIFADEEEVTKPVGEIFSIIQSLLKMLEAKEELQAAASSEITELRGMLAKISSEA